jgi:hypothetical protein
MTFSAFVRRLSRVSQKAASSSRRRRKRARPTLEVLEHRLVPSTVEVKNLADGGDGSLSLRDYIRQVDQGSQIDTIQLDAGTYMLDRVNGNGDLGDASAGDLTITNTQHTLLIQGTVVNGQIVTVIDAGRLNDRLFEVAPGVKVEFKDVILGGGHAHDDGMVGSLPGQTDSLGGAILSLGGFVALDNVQIVDCQARGGNGADGSPGFAGANGHDAYGGAICAKGGDLTLNNVLIVDNSAVGGKGGQGGNSVFPSIDPGAGGAGGRAAGGGIYTQGVVLKIANTHVWLNSADGGNGGVGGLGLNLLPMFKQVNGGAGGDGGYALGGGLDAEGSVSIHDSDFQANHANGGNGNIGGEGRSGGDGGHGGIALGGGISLALSPLFETDFSHVTLSSNKAFGGAGGDAAGGTARGGNGGEGGFADGGALFAIGERSTGSPSVVQFMDGTVADNLAMGGKGGGGSLNAHGDINGGYGGDGGHGGGASGGGFATAMIDLTVANTPFDGNIAEGGAGGGGGDGFFSAHGPGGYGGDGGNGGSAKGGALAMAASSMLHLSQSTFGHDHARGGDGGVGGNGGSIFDKPAGKGGWGGFGGDASGGVLDFTGNSPDGQVFVNVDHCFIGIASSANGGAGGTGGLGGNRTKSDLNAGSGGHGGNGGAARGGGFHLDNTTCLITNTTFEDLSAVAGHAGDGGEGGTGKKLGGLGGDGGDGQQAEGGALFLENGSYEIKYSTIDTNLVQGGHAGAGGARGLNQQHKRIGPPWSGRAGATGPAMGGGIACEASVCTLGNSTVYGNLVLFPKVLDVKKATAGQGGGIYAAGGNNLNLLDVTIAKNGVLDIPPGGNELPGEGGGVYLTSDVVLKANNTLIATNQASQGPDVYGSFDSADHNLVGIVDQYTSFQNPGVNFTGTPNSPLDPLLLPLANNGGPTKTCALGQGSPALGNGNPKAIDGTVDQRGMPRVVNKLVDIGAFQTQTSTPPPPPPTTGPAGGQRVLDSFSEILTDVLAHDQDLQRFSEQLFPSMDQDRRHEPQSDSFHAEIAARDLLFVTEKFDMAMDVPSSRWRHATARQAKQQSHLPSQGAHHASPGEGLDSWFDAVWKDFTLASS